jgi:IclR family acetate operon transcriptional repressor
VSAAESLPKYPIESVDNALRLLLMFREQPTIRGADASRSIGVARSTAHRLLAMLQYHGLVEQDPESRAYHAGPALIEIGISVVREMDVRSAARPHIERLCQDVGETVHLAVLDGTEVLFIDSVESTKALRVGSRMGTRMPAHLTSLGKAMLAALPDERVRDLYPDEELAGWTAHSIVTRTELLRSLEEVRRMGYATNFGESEEVGAVGMAVCGPAGTPRASISVSAPSPRLDDALVARIVTRLRSTVDTVATTVV